MMKLILERWNRFINEAEIDEAIVDPAREELSEIFDDKGRMKEEVVGVIKDATSKIGAWLSKTFPGAKIEQVFVVGAAVTHQYAHDSDIDTSIVASGIQEKDIKTINKWIEANIVYPSWKPGVEDQLSGQQIERPFEFKMMLDNKGYQHADAAYDPLQQSWLKKQDYETAHTHHAERVLNPDSKDNQDYAKVERAMHNLLNDVYGELEVASSSQLDEGISEGLKDIFRKAINRYNGIKAFRGKSYEKDPKASNLISQNWGRGNVIYKMLDTEGYLSIFADIKDALKDFSIVDSEFIEDLKQKIKTVLGDEIGYSP
jgi:hypothetical protein